MSAPGQKATPLEGGFGRTEQEDRLDALFDGLTKV